MKQRKIQINFSILRAGTNTLPLFFIISAFLLIFSWTATAQMYWTHSGGIDCAGFKGEGQKNIFSIGSGKSGDSEPRNVTVDTANNKVYWTETKVSVDEIISENSLWSANLDGAKAQEIVGKEIMNLIQPGLFPFAIDVVGKKMYWVSLGPGGTTILRLNLDGTGIPENVVIIGVGIVSAIAIDTVERKIYWVVKDESVTKIQRANLDGLRLPEDVVTIDTEVPPLVIAVDSSVSKRIYWIGVNDNSEATIRYANIAGGSQDDLVNLGFTYATSLTIDTAQKKIYCMVEMFDLDTFEYSTKIRRVNLDGSGVLEDVVKNLGESWRSSIAIDSPGGRIYWTISVLDSATNQPSGKIQWASISTGIPQEVMYGDKFPPKGITIDTGGGKIYWTNPGKGVIQRANLDGSDFEPDFIIGLNAPEGIAVNIRNQELFWTAGDKIQRANLDGSDVQDVVTGLGTPRGIAIDPNGGKVYWTDTAAGIIQIANIDGSGGVKNLITGLDNPVGIAVEVSQKKLYWTANAKIQRAKLDGTGVEDIKVANVSGIQYLALIPNKFPIGDVSGDNLVNSYDAALILQYSVGLIDRFPVEDLIGNAPENSVPRHYEIAVPSLAVTAGERFSVPIEINDTTGYIAGAINLKYNTAVLKASDAYLGLKGAYWQANTNLDGEVRVAFASTQATQPSQTLFVIEFDVLADAEGKESKLILDYVELSNSLSIQKKDGLLTVLPSISRLHQNYPNPFNPETWIPYELAADANIEISIYDGRGHLVRQLSLGMQSAGSYLTKDKAAYWDGQNTKGEIVSSGVYFYVLKAGDFVATRKMLMLK